MSIGVMLVLLTMTVPLAASGGISGIFWAFAITLTLVWWALRVARVRDAQHSADASAERKVDDGRS